MYRDVDLVWRSGFPYDILAEYGITPSSTMMAVQDVDFDIPPDRIAGTRTAIFEIEEIQNRLVTDFFLYQGAVRPEMDRDHDE